MILTECSLVVLRFGLQIPQKFYLDTARTLRSFFEMFLVRRIRNAPYYPTTSPLPPRKLCRSHGKAAEAVM